MPPIKLYRLIHPFGRASESDVIRRPLKARPGVTLVQAPGHAAAERDSADVPSGAEPHANRPETPAEPAATSLRR